MICLKPRAPPAKPIGLADAGRPEQADYPGSEKKGADIASQYDAVKAVIAELDICLPAMHYEAKPMRLGTKLIEKGVVHGWFSLFGILCGS